MMNITEQEGELGRASMTNVGEAGWDRYEKIRQQDASFVQSCLEEDAEKPEFSLDW